MKKLFCAVLSLSLFVSPAAQAIDLGDFDNIDAIMEDNAFNDTANRYASLQLSYFPENATRIGFESADRQLDLRNAERDAQALRAYTIVQENLQDVKRKNLSEPRKTEYDMLQARLALDKWNLRRDRTSMDPLLYSQAFDAVYDLALKSLSYSSLQNRDLAARVKDLTATAAQAEKNLTSTPAFLAQLAMEDAYYAYLSFDEIPQQLAAAAQDDVTRAQIRTEATASKQAVKEMFELFKTLAKENRTQDFRLGEKDYAFLLKNRYFIDQKPRAMEKYLVKNFAAAQKNLAKALEIFAIPTQAEGEETLTLTDIQVPGEENTQPVTVTPIQNAKKTNSKLPAVKASDFYAVQNRLVNGVKNQNFTDALAKEADNLAKFFAQDNTLPTSAVQFYVRPLPSYYAYTRPYLFLPPFGMQSNPRADLFLRLPHGNESAKQEMLDKDFNVFTLKLLMAGQLVPGLAYRSGYQYDTLSNFRKMYPVPTMRNGWEVYAQHLAKERGYIVTDEELLFLAWADYVRAAEALTDFYVHTRQYTYAEALTFLTEKNGFATEQAEAALKQIARQPGEAVSYIYGYDALKDLRAKYQKKQGKKFSSVDFHSKLMSFGDIPTSRLEAEMENAYKVEKTRLTQALSTPFYLN